jgi:hypothetical protein
MRGRTCAVHGLRSCPWSPRLRANQDTGDITAGRAFISDQSGVVLDRGDPRHVLHRGLAARAPWGAFSFFQAGHERIPSPTWSRTPDEFAGCVGVPTLRCEFLCYGTREHQSCFWPLSMPIRAYLDGHKFDGETTRQMGIAFEMALASLGATPGCDEWVSAARRV